MKQMALLGLMLPMFLGVLVHAQSLQSYCYSDPKDFSKVQGQNVDKKYPIASVSKLVTSYWALSSLGPQFQFLSYVYVTPVDNQTVDVHLKGSRDPYFGREKMHFVISKLNEKGITKVRKLSFDENFLYLRDLDIERDITKESKSFPWKNYYVSQVGPKKTLAELKRGPLTEGYSNSVKHLSSANIKLLPNASISVQEIAYLPSTDFKSELQTKVFGLRSAPLFRLLKEMNRNSNNFAAVEIFKVLGGKEKFAAFIKNRLGLSAESIEFHEGSGNRVANEPVYNEATCRALLTIFRALTEEAKKHMMDIDDIASVMGEDDGLKRYTSDVNDGSGVAKTGTSAAAMSLGGMLNTKPNRVYFMFNVNPVRFTGANKAASRSLIGNEVRKLSKLFADSIVELDYKKITFASFDATSFFEIPASKPLP